MSQQFGRHTHGFYALIGMVRDWVKTLPLSGEPATTGKNSKSTENVRVGFIQFSGNAASTGPTGGVVGSALRAPPNVGTGGRLSGATAELNSDMTWHEDN